MTSPCVTIEQGSTALYLYCLASGRLAENQAISIFKFLQQYLTEYEFDHRSKVNKPKYFYYRYDKEQNVLYLPVNILPYLEQWFHLNLVEYQIIKLPPIESKPIIIKNISSFKDRDYQVDSINHLLSPGMRALELQTGCICGKTPMVFSDGKKTREITLEEAYRTLSGYKLNKYQSWFNFIPFKVQSYIGTKIIFHDIIDIVYTGVKPVIRLIFNDGAYLDCTHNHLILTELGWIDAIDCLNHMVICTNQKSSGSVFEKQIVQIKDIGLKPTYDILCEDPYHNFVANDAIVHNSGKTYIAVRTITELKKRSLIIVPASLLNQWVDAFSSMCDAKLNIIKGNKSIYNIINNEYNVDYDVFIASINTLKDYAAGISVFNIFPIMSEFIKNLQIGVKIIDECHLNFNANTITDIMCGNVEHNIYLSATYMRSSHSSNQIFKRVFPDEIKYDGGLDYSRYVNITELGYTFGEIDDKKVNTDRGYSQYKYEKYLMKRPKYLNAFLDTILQPAIDRFFNSIRENREKLLIIVGMQDFANTLTDWMRELYPALTTVPFFYETEEKELENADVIISTLGSCGTGKDIVGLRTLILFTSFNTEVLTFQTIGRLRKMKNTPEFIYLVNRGIRAHQRHSYQRRKIYKSIGKTFNYVDYISK